MKLHYTEPKCAIDVVTLYKYKDKTVHIYRIKAQCYKFSKTTTEIASCTEMAVKSNKTGARSGPSKNFTSTYSCPANLLAAEVVKIVFQISSQMLSVETVCICMIFYSYVASHLVD